MLLFISGYSSAPIVFVDSELTGHYEVITLTFSDDTAVEVISEHGFWDADLNEYVYLDENAEDYIGHSFLNSSLLNSDYYSRAPPQPQEERYMGGYTVLD